MSAPPASRLACGGCGRSGTTPFAWRCPAADAGDGVDHLMERTLDLSRVRFPADIDADPFVRYRTLLHSWQVATSAGMSDEAYCSGVRRLSARCQEVAGRAFVVTPFRREAQLSERLGFAAQGGVWVKDETVNVAGSHKARHLMGLALDLEVMEAGDPALRAEHDRRGLAIASCGNAALAAAVVACAAGRPLTVYIPTDADRPVVARITALGARAITCPRVAGEPGDPTVAAFRVAVAQGAIPFCCQGSENGLTIEGGETLAWEIASALGESGGRLERLFVQVGGGALASACFQGLAEAAALGAFPGLPRLHTVQTEGAAPLPRAYRELRHRIVSPEAGHAGAEPAGDPREDDRLARIMWDLKRTPQVLEALAYARSHRAEFMWAWEATPHSIAHGILDDETYDWFAITRGTIESGGFPVVVTESRLREAHRLARETTGIAADPTGTSGLAGLLALREAGVVGADERVAVLFTGVER